MAVVINSAYGVVKPIRIETSRPGRRFYHLATMKLTGDGFVVARGRYDVYGDKAEGLWTDSGGRADFPADGGSASIWIEDGAGLDG
jgi:alpha-amylase